VDVSAQVENPSSEPVPNAFIKYRQLRHVMLTVLIMSRLRFVGRYYVMNEDVNPLHRSDTCLVMRANNYGLANAYSLVLYLSLSDKKKP
jgi:hypothetical protein